MEDATFPLGQTISTKVFSMAIIADKNDQVNMCKAIGKDEMTLIPFESGTKASSLDSYSMVQNSTTLVLHESVTKVDDGDPWIIVSSECS